MTVTVAVGEKTVAVVVELHEVLVYTVTVVVMVGCCPVSELDQTVP